MLVRVEAIVQEQVSPVQAAAGDRALSNGRVLLLVSAQTSNLACRLIFTYKASLEWHAAAVSNLFYRHIGMLSFHSRL